MAKEGYIRVILTTNFDRLLEQAFEAEGVTPQVISHESAIAQATPLVHCKIPTIIILIVNLGIPRRNWMSILL